MSRIALQWLSAVLLVIAGTLPAQADSVESALMPGKVIEGHAKLEGDCKNCHVRFNKAAQTGVCLDCHKDVAADVRGKRGYHGRITENECRTCHTEHKGRNMNIAPVDERRFDHSLTDFMLRGKHGGGQVECKECHVAHKKFRDAPSDCVACHRKDDAHKGSLGTACANCHSEKSWKDVRFDHASTRFPLLGKHIDVPCKSCHQDPKFKGAPTACVACHKKDDEHKGRFGSKCETCHTAKDWNGIVFDHARETRYALKGQHAKIECSACHKGSLYRDKLPTDCYACHQEDDKHKGQEGKLCAQCHNERSWRDTLFDHGLSRFPLLGKHTKVACKKCHLTPAFKDAEKDCVACHRKDDVHKRRLGTDCGSCHNARNWKAWQFDHNRQTRFKLDGGHRNVNCVACHIRPIDGRISLAGTCVSCHDRDDVHDGSFGKQCERCHVSSSFKKVRMGSGFSR